jgi:hypothetical protein
LKLKIGSVRLKLPKRLLLRHPLWFVKVWLDARKVNRTWHLEPDSYRELILNDVYAFAEHLRSSCGN